MTPLVSDKTIRFAIPKGRMPEDVLSLLREAGVSVSAPARNYRPSISLDGFELKVLMPRAIVEMLAVGARDCGFAGADWVAEANADLVELLDTGLSPVRLIAAAAIAGTDEFLAVGGAHANAAMAHGWDGFRPCDVIVGPGNKWVTAAKQLVSGVVGIDMLAGPSELLVVADDSADPEFIAADLIAQAEHDHDAIPMLVTTDPRLANAVDAALFERLRKPPTRETARTAFKNSFACVVGSMGEACNAADRIAAEHVEIMTRDPQSVAKSIRNAGAFFIGAQTAEVLGDYGAGPNHTLPTGGTARFQSGLSVMHFLRLRSWMRIDDRAQARDLVSDACDLADIEGLAGYAASAQARQL